MKLAYDNWKAIISFCCLQTIYSQQFTITLACSLRGSYLLSCLWTFLSQQFTLTLACSLRGSYLLSCLWTILSQQFTLTPACSLRGSYLLSCLWTILSQQFTLTGVWTQNILEHSECCNFQTITVMHRSLHFLNGNESENPFLISKFTKNDDILRKWQKNTFLVKIFGDKLTKIALR